MTVLELKPIKDPIIFYEMIEKAILKALKEYFYLPMLREIGPGASVQNSRYDLHEAIITGRIQFSRGQFTGRFNAAISRELRKLGAKWDRKQGSFKIPLSSLPARIKEDVRTSETRFKAAVKRIDKKLGEFLPEEIAEKVSLSKIFDATIYKVDQDIKKSVKAVTVMPEFTAEDRKRISDEWSENMKIWIKDFTEKEIKSLRQDIQENVMSGNRYENITAHIQKSYGVSQNKARFLARQETNLLVAKLKEIRYEDAGVNEYRWGCVAGSPGHEVRAMHKALEGRVFTWDNPPVTSPDGRKNNPGQDYNCRCFARPIVRIK